MQGIPCIKMFYEYLRQGKKRGLECKDCQKFIFPPVSMCPNCGSNNLSWKDISGKGELLCFSVVHSTTYKHQALTPYVEGIVKLEEGNIFCTLITGLDPQKPEEIMEKRMRVRDRPLIIGIIA